jgi:hypothetical protein
MASGSTREEENMRTRRLLVLAFLTLALAAGSPKPAPGQESATQKIPLPVVDAKLRSELLGYLEKHYQSPEDYILSKFKDHEIVFVGEYHRIQHDVLLIQKMIPLLYRAGIHSLGIEFGIHRDQDRVDKLINAAVYDEQAAREIMFDEASYWGYREYMDIYRAAWNVNHALPVGAPRFRVVNLNAYSDWSFVKTETDRNNPEVMKKVLPEGEWDKVMAENILNEFVAKGEKALIYSGMHHAFTRYKQPIYYQGKFIRFVEDRMGNLVREKLGDKVFTIFLHSPWSDKNYENELYPAGGVIDAVLAERHDLRPVGFDLAGTPFGELCGPGSIYEVGYHHFTLKLYADGWIFTKPLSQYQGVTFDDKFITEANFKRAIEQITNPEFKNKATGVEVLNEAMRDDANMPRRFRQFH